MEDVLDLYEAPYDPQRPKVCLDEKPVVLRSETRPAHPAVPGPDGHPQRRDCEYVREGTANLFVLVEPQTGWRHVAVTEQRTYVDYAAQLRYLADEVYPDAEVIRIVQDNLNTHGPHALYAAFPPEEAQRLRQRFEFHPTPKHGSWLNMAEIEISIFERGCLARPVPDLATLRSGVAAVEVKRNAARATFHWQFTSQQARLKLPHLYPTLQTKPD